MHLMAMNCNTFVAEAEEVALDDNDVDEEVAAQNIPHANAKVHDDCYCGNEEQNIPRRMEGNVVSIEIVVEA